MAFYLRRRYETDAGDTLVLSDSDTKLTASTVTDSGSGAFVGSDTVDIATLRTAVRALQTAVADIQGVIGS